MLRMWKFQLLYWSFISIRLYCVLAPALKFRCECRCLRDSAIACTLLATVQLARGLFTGELMEYAVAAGIWVFLALTEGGMWWFYWRKNCKHNNDDRGKRLKSWAKSKIPKPKVITRIQPAGGRA